jgi:hypothetical protein
MMTAQRRRGRSSFLSQIPSVPPTVAQPDALTDFFTLVQRTYERAQEAMETAKSGYNADVAKATISGGGGVIENNDKAWEALKKAKAEGVITAEDASTLAYDVMGPLGGAIGQAKAALIENEGRNLNFYWNTFSDFVAKTIANSTGFVTEKWHNLLKVYRLVDDYLNSSDAFAAWAQTSAQSPEAVSYLSTFKMTLGSLAAHRSLIETQLQAVGIPASVLKEQAAKEDVANLGAEPAGILGTVIVGSLTVGILLKVLAGIFSAFVFFMFGVFDTILPVVGLERLVLWRLKRNERNAELAKSELDKEKGAKSVAEAKAQQDKVKKQLDDAQKTLEDLAKVLKMQKEAEDLKKRIEEERRKAGTDVSWSWNPWILAIGGGVIVAAAIYWYNHRTSK